MAKKNAHAGDAPGIYARRSTETTVQRSDRLRQERSESRPLLDRLDAVGYSLRLIALASGPETETKLLSLQSVTNADPTDPDVVADAADARRALLHVRRAIALQAPEFTLSRHELESLIEKAISLGWLLERLRIWAFDGEIRAKRRSQNALAVTNAERGAKTETLYREAMKAIEDAEREFPARSGEKTFVKKKAAQQLGIGVNALNARLRKFSVNDDRR